MAQAPMIPERTVLIEEPQARISAADMVRGEMAIAEALQQGGTAVQEIAGSVQRLANTEESARLSGRIERFAVDLERQIPHDPASWQTAFREGVDRIITGASPQVASHGRQVAERVETTSYRRLVGESFRRNAAQADAGLQTEYQRRDNELDALARSGQYDGERAAHLLSEQATMLRRRVDEPASGLTIERANETLAASATRHQALALVGRVERAGSFEEGARMLDGLRRDTSLNLSSEQRERFVSMGLGALRQRFAVERAAATALDREGAELVRLARAQDAEATDDRLEDYLGRARAGGSVNGYSDVAGILAARRAFGPRLDAARSAEERAVVSTSRAPADIQAVVGQTLNNLIGHESGNNPRARNPDSTATGLGQFIESTWLNTIQRHRPDLMQGRSRAQVLALRTEPGIAREMTTRLAEDNAMALQRAGHPVTPGTVYLAHFLGEAGARRALSAGADTPVEQAVDADAIRANGSVFRQNRTVGQLIAWADRIGNGRGRRARGGGGIGGDERAVAPDTLPMPLPAEPAPLLTAGMSPRESLAFTAETRRMLAPALDDFARRVDAYETPDVSESRRLLEMAAYGTPQQQQRAAELVVKAEVAAGLLEDPTAARREARIAQLRGEAASGEGWLARVADHGSRMREQVETGWRNDPYLQATRQRIIAAPPPLDWSSPEAIRAALAARVEMQDVIRARQVDIQPFSALRPGEAQGLAGALRSAPLAQQTAILGALGALPRPVLDATLAGLASNAETRPLAFVAGLHQRDPRAAESVLRGTRLLAENDKLAPSGDTWRNAATAALPPGALAPELQAAREDAMTAVRAAYADASASAGDEDASRVNVDRMRGALRAVFGGPLLDWNGGAVIAPRRGMNQATFEGVLGGLADADFASARTASGLAVTAEEVRRDFRLRMVAEGQYVLSHRSNPSMFLMAGSGRRFLLDLRDRQPQPARPETIQMPTAP